MSKSIKIDGFEDAVKRTLEVYEKNCTEIVQKAVPKVAANAVVKLKSTSPKRTGDYAKSWKSKVEKTAYGSSAVVYNEKHYRLTHLLENGHAKAGGGRVEGQPHIGPVNDKVEDELLDTIVSLIEDEV